jgi:hypothetical protein
MKVTLSLTKSDPKQIPIGLDVGGNSFTNLSLSNNEI